MQDQMMPPQYGMQYGPIINQPVSPSDQMNAGSMMADRVQNIVTQIDPERLLTDIEHRIRRQKKDHFSQQWVKIDENQPEVSPLLVANLISRLSAYLTNNVTFSNYTEQEINNLMHIIINDTIEDLSANAAVYGIANDYNERNRITEIICTTIWAALKRALKGKEASSFWRSVTISGDINNVEGQEQKKRGFKDYLKFW